MYVYQTICRSSIGCMCTWWIPEVGYPSYMYTMYRYSVLGHGSLVERRMATEYLDNCIHSVQCNSKKSLYSVLVFSIIIFFSVDNSYSKIDPSDQVKQKKENTGNEARLVCSYKKVLVCLPTHLAMQILSKFVWLEKQKQGTK